MKVIVNGREVGTKEQGCALCGSTWGEYYDVIEGQRLFFCCDLCAKGFREIVESIKERWGQFDELIINGNYASGRHCTARVNGLERRFYVRFNDNAELEVFREEP